MCISIAILCENMQVGEQIHICSCETCRYCLLVFAYIAVMKNFISCSLAECAACNEQLHQTHEDDLMVHKIPMAQENILL